MTKTQLIDQIAKDTGLTKKDVGAVCDALFGRVAESLAAGEGIQIAGFGAFSAKDRPARTGRNPKTGEPIAISASRAVVFTAGKSLKDQVNSGTAENGTGL